MAESSITFKVSMISGAEGTVSGDAAETLADVKGKVMEVLNLSMSSVSLFLDSAPGEELQDDRSIKDLSGCNLLVVVPSEPEWCTNKCFTQEYIRGRRCGMEETSEDVEVRILSGGEFAFKRKHHDHDAECGYSHDSSWNSRVKPPGVRLNGSHAPGTTPGTETITRMTRRKRKRKIKTTTGQRQRSSTKYSPRMNY
ncbi:unnamed protein product [Durusdinium trenchii]|uniref:Ubiquitin-like domain-containing protein n=1 Tax=Durusdinium trenchii TaxID=1381693 RepID=A0ABP0MAI1_9DINO